MCKKRAQMYIFAIVCQMNENVFVVRIVKSKYECAKKLAHVYYNNCNCTYAKF